MLNELRELGKSLRECNASLKDIDPRLGPCSGAVKLMARILADGSVIVEPTPIDRQYLKFETSKGNTYPTFNVPLLAGKVDGAGEKLKSLKKAIAEGQDKLEESIKALLACQDGWQEVYKEKSTQRTCLAKVPEALSKALGPIPSKYEALNLLEQRVSKLDMRRVRAAIEAFIVEQAKSKPGESEQLLNDFVFAKKEKSKFVLVLDIGLGESDVAIHSTEMMEWVNETLLSKSKSEKPAGDLLRKDAYGNPMPNGSVNLPEAGGVACLGNVRLRAMPDESLCNQRYGMSKADSFPIGEESVAECKSALEWIGAKHREGKTWARLGGGAAIFAYLANIPKVDGPLACLFSETNELDFEEATKSVIGALDLSPGKADDVKVFIMEKPGPSSIAQVTCSRKCSAEQLVKQADDWKLGCGKIAGEWNVGTANRPIVVAPRTPYPSDVVRLLNEMWICLGLSSKESPSFSYADGISLLLDLRPWIAHAMLSVAIRNWTPLLASMGEASHRLDGNKEIFNRYFMKKAGLAVSAVSLLLHKTKGVVMNSPYYALGRVLALSDILHAEYCKEVRKGLPRQLFGSSLLMLAYQSPLSAYARFAERFIPYQGWAATCGSDRARKAVDAMRELSPIMQEAVWSKPNDATKAETVTGFLSQL